MKKFLLLVLFAVMLLLPFRSYAEQNLGSWLTIGGDYQARLDYLQGSTPSFYGFGGPAGSAGAQNGAFFDAFMTALPAFHLTFAQVQSLTPAQLQGLESQITPATVAGLEAGGFITTAQGNALLAGTKASAGEDFRNNSLLTNRFGLNFMAKPLENIHVKARLVMYKAWGSDSANPVDQNMFFMDRAGTFDGVQGHVPGSDNLLVDYAYATWSNIADQPVWFSVGRRPSTGGVPGNLRRNAVNIGTAGVPNLLIDYAFDGFSLGWAPYIEALPGAYAKFCGGRGFDSGFSNLHDTNFAGLFVVPYNTDQLEITLQWDRGIDVFDAPPDFAVPTTATSGVQEFLNPTSNVGNIDWYGAVAQGMIKNVNYFAAGALSHAMPNGNRAGAFGPFIEQSLGYVDQNTGFPLAQSALTAQQAANVKNLEPQMLDGQNHTGWAIYLGARYDINSTRTKLGAEFNHGSKDWIGFVPAGDDMWTSKLGTRGDVYELYAIQEIHAKPIDKLAVAYFRLGWQYYDIKYTGSNNWLGAPLAMSDLASSPLNAQIFAPIKSAQDVYFTFNVNF